MVAMRISGKRKHLTMDRDGIPQLYLDKGDYGKDRNNTWWIRLPKTGVLISLLDLAHPVKEEAGGRITVGGVFEEEDRTSDKQGIRKWSLVSGEWREEV